MEQRSIPNLHRGIDGDSQISQNRTGYDEIECNRDKQKTGGTGYLLLTVKANPTLSFRIQEFGMNQTSPSRIRTYDQSVNSRPLYHWATEEQREIWSHRVQFPFSTHDQYELEVSFVTRGTSSQWLRSMPHFKGNLKVALFHYIPPISKFHSF